MDIMEPPPFYPIWIAKEDGLMRVWAVLCAQLDWNAGETAGTKYVQVGEVGQLAMQGLKGVLLPGSEQEGVKFQRYTM